MRIGLLVCDDLHEGLPAGLPTYPELMARLVGPGARTVVFRCHAGELPDTTALDGWVVSGSRASVNDGEPWIAGVAEIVQETVAAGQPTVGLCFGHQLVHAALGGRVAPAGEWGLGAYPVTTGRASPLAPRGATLRIRSVHQDQVAEPAPGLVTLAGSAFCPHYLSHGGCVLSVQGHPEFDRPFYEAVLDRARARAGDAAVAAARAALPARDDSSELRSWIRSHLGVQGRGH